MDHKFILTVIESPYAPKGGRTVEHHLNYLRGCMAHSFSLGEAPYASHALYTQDGVLDDRVPEERRKGMAAGFAWGEHATRRVFYIDYGFTKGMAEGYQEAKRLGQLILFRSGVKSFRSDSAVYETSETPPWIRAELRSYGVEP